MSILDRIAGLFSKPAPASPAPLAAPTYSVRTATVIEAPTPPPPPKLPTPISRRVINRTDSDITALEGPVKADISINLTGCKKLRSLPEGLVTGTLTLSYCTALEELPAGLSVAFLDLDGCTSLRELPEDLVLRGGRLILKGCAQLTHLPEGMGEVAHLDLSGCANIDSLPAGLTITSSIDVAGSGISGLPDPDDAPDFYDQVGIRWNGVAVSRQVAFAPETLTREEVLAERDPEVRQIMLERTGYKA